MTEKHRLDDGRLIKVSSSGSIRVDLEDEQTAQLYLEKIKQLSKHQKKIKNDD